MGKRQKSQPAQANSMNWPRACRDIVLESIRRGQGLLTIVLVIVLIIVSRLPSDALGKLTIGVGECLQKIYMIGWFLFAIMLMLTFVIVRFQRSIYHKELDRMAKERDKLQKLLKIRTQSSKKNEQSELLECQAY